MMMEDAAGLDSLSRWRVGAQLVGLQTQHEHYKSTVYPLFLAAEPLQLAASRRGGSSPDLLSGSSVDNLAAAAGGSGGASSGTPFTTNGGLMLTPDDQFGIVGGGTSFQTGVVQVLDLTANGKASGGGGGWSFGPSVESSFWLPHGSPVNSLCRANTQQHKPLVAVGSNNGQVLLCDENVLLFGTGASGASGSGSALPVLATLQAAPNSSLTTKPIKEHISTSSQAAHTTLVKHVRFHSRGAGSTSGEVIAARDSTLYWWDLHHLRPSGSSNASSSPTSLRYHSSNGHNTSATGGGRGGSSSSGAQQCVYAEHRGIPVSETITTAEWCPTSSHLLPAVGTTEGNVQCYDLRLTSAAGPCWIHNCTQSGAGGGAAGGGGSNQNSQAQGSAPGAGGSENSGNKSSSAGRGAVTQLRPNPLHENLIAYSSLCGQIVLFDVRKASHTLLNIPAAQRGVTSLQWFPHQSDMLASGGVDGTVRLWNVRHSPSFCVSTQQFRSGAVHAVQVTQSSYRPNVLATTNAGELVCITPSLKALHSCAPRLPQRTAFLEQSSELVQARSTGDGSGGALSREQQQKQQEREEKERMSILALEQKGVELLYARQEAKAHEKILQAVLKRLHRRESRRATEILSYLQEIQKRSFSYIPPSASDSSGGGLTKVSSCTVGGVVETIPLDMSFTLRKRVDPVKEFREWIHSPVEFAAIPTTARLTVTDLDPVPTEVSSRLRAVRVNAIAGALVETRDVDTLLNRLPLLKELVRGGGHHTLECLPLVADAIQLLLEERPLEALVFIQSLVDDCVVGLSTESPQKTDYLAEEEQEGGIEEEEKRGRALGLKKLLMNIISPSVLDLDDQQQQHSTPTDVEGEQGEGEEGEEDDGGEELATTRRTTTALNKHTIKRMKQRAEDYLSDLSYLRAAVHFELKITRVTLTSHDPCRLVCQAGKEFDKTYGIYRLISLSPLMTYLHALLGLGQYGSFFVTAAQWYQRNMGFPRAAMVRQLFLQELHRLRGTMEKMTASLQALVTNGATHSGAVDSSEKLLKRFHPFVLGICRIVIGAEEAKNASRSDLDLLDEVVDVLGDAMADALESWAELLGLMSTNRYSQKALRDLFVAFKREVLHFIKELSAQEDDTLQAILDECQQFVAR